MFDAERRRDGAIDAVDGATNAGRVIGAGQPQTVKNLGLDVGESHMAAGFAGVLQFARYVENSGSQCVGWAGCSLVLDVVL